MGHSGVVCKLQYCRGLPQGALEVKFEHCVLFHHINGNSHINQGMWDHGAIDVDINYCFQGPEILDRLPPPTSSRIVVL